MEPKNPFLGSKVYDQLKFLTLIALPGVGALYFGLAQIWGLPKPGEVNGTISVICVFLGVMLGLSSSQYKKSDAPYDGVVNITQRDDGSQLFDLALNGGPENLANQRAVNLKVVTPVETELLE